LQESILKKLQSGVESEETTWKARLSEKDDELSHTKDEIEDLEKKNASLEESLKVVGQAEEVRYKI
jgi:predicted nuclease with TOPRIM domain